METLKLALDDLAVASFATAEEVAEGAGTVRGREMAVSLDLRPCSTGGWCKSQMTCCICTPRAEAL